MSEDVAAFLVTAGLTSFVILHVVSILQAGRIARDATNRMAEIREMLRLRADSVTNRLEGLAKVARATHALVDSSVATQLRAYATLARKTAASSGLAEDVVLADAAEAAYREHLMRQAVTAAPPATDVEKQGQSPAEV